MKMLFRRRGYIDAFQPNAGNKLITDCKNAFMRNNINKSNNNNNDDLEDLVECLLTGNRHTASFNNWLCPDSLQKVQTTSNPDCRDVTEMCDKMMETEQQIAKEVNEFMFDRDVLDIRRRELLHRKWTDRVYDPIRNHVSQEVNSKNYENMLLHKRLLYDSFLTKSNRKEHMCLDIFEHADPNLPLSLTARFGRLNDPLLQSGRTRIEEDRIAMQCVTGERLPSAAIERLRLPPLPLIPRGREGTTWKQWVSMNVSDIESPEHQRSRKMRNPNKNHSLVAWDCYHRSCPDDPSTPKAKAAAAAAAEASTVADAEHLCGGGAVTSTADV